MEKARLIGLGFVGDSVSCGALGAYFARKGNTGWGSGGGGGRHGLYDRTQCNAPDSSFIVYEEILS